MNSEKNYFVLFGMPVSFDIDTAELTTRYRELQKAVHPDKFASHAEQEKTFSVQRAALINDAYNALKNPLLRAKYMLELNGFSIDDEKNQIMEPAFLMRQMEWRESLEASCNDIDALEELIDQFQQLYNSCVEKIKHCFTDSSPTYSNVADNVRKMQFFIRLIEEAESLIVTLENK